jgi:anti-sigma-K factor RskA
MHPIRRTAQMVTKKTMNRKREFESSRGGMRKKSLMMISAAIVVAAALVAILFNTVLANHQPAMISLTAEQEQVLPLGRSQIVCNASDPDEDELSYRWSASGASLASYGGC